MSDVFKALCIFKKKSYFGNKNGGKYGRTIKEND